MSTAEPERRPKRHRREQKPIPNILPPTARSCLATLGAHTKASEGATSSSSAAPSSTRQGNALPGRKAPWEHHTETSERFPQRRSHRAPPPVTAAPPEPNNPGRRAHTHNRTHQRTRHGERGAVGRCPGQPARLRFCLPCPHRVRQAAARPSALSSPPWQQCGHGPWARHNTNKEGPAAQSKGQMR